MRTSKIILILALSVLTLKADFQTGETIENKYQGVHTTFKNVTTVKIKDIPKCDKKEIKSTVFTSKINNCTIETKKGPFYIKEGIESGVKICIDEAGDLKIYSYKNTLFKKTDEEGNRKH